MIKHRPEASISEKLARQLIDSGRRRKWYLLHALGCLAKYGQTADALVAQIDVDTDPVYFDAVRSIARDLVPRQIIVAALKTEDVRIVHLAGEQVRDIPELLHSMNVNDLVWTDIWLSALEQGLQVGDGLNDPQQIVHQMLDNLRAEVQYTLKLLGYISRSRWSDLSAYPSREDIWNVLPQEVRESFLHATACAWVHSHQDIRMQASKVEPELGSAILSSWRNAPPASAVLVLNLSGAVLEFGEQDLIGWLTKHQGRGASRYSCDIGKLVLARGWRAAARALQQCDLLVDACRECQNLLSFIDRFLLKRRLNERIDIQDWWRAWEDVCCELYPEGVRQKNIWERSDGDIADIYHGSGREQWHHALQLLRNGSTGKGIRIEGVLHQMHNDFDNGPLIELEILWNATSRKQKK